MLHHSAKHTHQEGFTLVELTISIAIIALLITAITATMNVKRKADYNTMVSDMNDISAAVTSFQNTYHGIPGDLYDASSQIGSEATDGDGNGTIDTTNTIGSESLQFWDHLSLAGLITGSYDGASQEPGVGVMAGPFKNSGYYAASTSEGSVTITIGKYTGSAISDVTTDLDGILTPHEAALYDTTYDDGDPSSGSVRAQSGVNYGATDCASGSNYNTTNDDDACVVRVVIVAN